MKVVKKKTEDKYNTSKIKEKNKNNDKKNKNSNVNNKSKKDNNEKKSIFVKFRLFCSGVKSEFKRVHWPDKKDMVKDSIATIFFIIFCSLFFYAIDIIFALIQSLIN